jgi:FMN phosphatase YigB (HAD superfamily)
MARTGKRGMSSPAWVGKRGYREDMVTGQVPVEIPQGLVAFVAQLPETVRQVVVTNSEPQGARRMLVFLGVARLARHVVGRAHKPQGFGPAVHALLGDDLPPRAVSVGDNYVNDVASALALGMEAVHVRAPGAMTGPSSLTVERLEDALPWLWDTLTGKALTQGQARSRWGARGS